FEQANATGVVLLLHRLLGLAVQLGVGLFALLFLLSPGGVGCGGGFFLRARPRGSGVAGQLLLTFLGDQRFRLTTLGLALLRLFEGLLLRLLLGLLQNRLHADV